MLRAILEAIGLRKHEVVEVAWEKRISKALKDAGYPNEVEQILGDKARVDILMEHYAVEIDWAPKWAESIGQALYYALKTNRKPAILLLLEPDKNNKLYTTRAMMVAGHLTPRIAVWTFDVKTQILDMDGATIKVK